MRILKADSFPSHDYPDFGLPPGYVLVKSMQAESGGSGVLPDKKGNCLWVQVIKGSAADHNPTIWGELPDTERNVTQRLWLRWLRKMNRGIESQLGISPRTWEGWEQGRPIPYFQAVRLAHRIWDKSRTQ